MKLYLVRHGEAVSGQANPGKPLSERGRADVQDVASRLAEAGVRASILLHSGKLRARETAELLGPSVGVQERTQRSSGIDPLDPTEPFAREVEQWTADTMVVGHLPFMASLASRLLRGDEEASTVDFRAGTAACLEREGAGSWSLAWVIHPHPTAG